MRFRRILQSNVDSEAEGAEYDSCYLASKEELLALINAKAEDFPPALPHDPEFLVLGRRHAVSLRGILDALAG